MAELSLGGNPTATCVAISPCAAWLAATSVEDDQGPAQLHLWQAAASADGHFRHGCYRSLQQLLCHTSACSVLPSNVYSDGITACRVDETIRLPLAAAATALAFVPQGGIVPPLLAVSCGGAGTQLWSQVLRCSVLPQQLFADSSLLHDQQSRCSWSIHTCSRCKSWEQVLGGGWAPWAALPADAPPVSAFSASSQLGGGAALVAAAGPQLLAMSDRCSLHNGSPSCVPLHAAAFRLISSRPSLFHL